MSPLGLGLLLVIGGLLLLFSQRSWQRRRRRQKRERESHLQAILSEHMRGVRARQRILEYYLLASQAMEEEAMRAQQEKEWWRGYRYP